MKSKLLKKIRKQYDIIMYTEVDKNSDKFLVECKKELGLPFYVLEDWVWEIEGEALNRWAFTSLHEAKYKILDMVRSEYRHLSRRNKTFSEKVWYNKN